MKKDSCQYIVVTPCRNEEKNVPNLVQSLVAQTLRPVLWVIVDDSSTDKTGEIIAEANKQHDWIKVVNLKEHKGYMGTHYAYVCNKGFEFAKEYCKNNNIPYGYIALVDADNILVDRYFEKLIEEFEKDEILGIASGNSVYANVEKILNNLKMEKTNVSVMDNDFWRLCGSSFTYSREDQPMGSARMWRKECFEETGGYILVHAPDAISNVKAKLKGWKTRCFMDFKIIEREAATKEVLWKGWKDKGRSDFFMWYPLSFAVLKAIKYLFKRPYYTGIAYIYGYIEPLSYRENRINDDEIRKYYRYTRPQELKAYYKEKIKRLLIKT